MKYRNRIPEPGTIISGFADSEKKKINADLPTLDFCLHVTVDTHIFLLGLIYRLHLISCYTSFRGIFFLCFAYLHLRSRRSEDAGHVPLTTRRGVAAYTLSRHGVHIGRLKKNVLLILTV